jgi:hypothetical protein
VAATVVVAGDDLGAEVCARALAAAGVGRLRLVRHIHRPTLADQVLGALRASNPDVVIDIVAWPEQQQQQQQQQDDGPAAAGPAWLAILRGAAAVVRVGLDDDAMLRAAVYLGVPAVVLRGTADAADVISFRRHGPCPHQDLDVPEQPASTTTAGDGPAAVVAAHVASAEALVIVAGATTGEARARHLRVRLGTSDDGGSPATSPSPAPTLATDIPWTPECFACGGTGSEMSFS